MLSPSERRMRARIGAHQLHSRYSGTEITSAARETAQTNLNARLLQEIDPDHSLTERERARRLEHGRKAHFARLALKSAMARRKGAK